MNSAAKSLDPKAHAVWARLFSSVSPISSQLAWFDWASHLALSPGKRFDLWRLALRQMAGLMCQSLPHQCEQLEPLSQADRRFRDPAWQQWPFSLWRDSLLKSQQWWEQATQDIQGLDPHHQKVVAFGARQWLDMFSPGNTLFTNPVVLKRTQEEAGANLLRGFNYLLEDIERKLGDLPPAGAENFAVGRDVAVTPGKVVFRNQLIELIQYAPATDKVHPEPILIVPAWIMKYYILDLSPHNSLIRYLVDRGHTVFCISWKNPGWEERNLDMDDYLDLGVHAALDAVNAIVTGQPVHAAGYCIGGTLLAIAVAAMTRDGQADRLASLTLFTAQTDFSEPGELSLFIDESQVAMLEAQMAYTGCLRADQMAGAFQMLRSYDLLWSRLVNEYLLGERQPMFDLMAWNADATRMPARMHSQYLRRLYLNDDLSEGRYPVRGRPISLSDLKLPVFSVGTLTDHVAPWVSVYKLHYLSPAEMTFVLTSGGHNAGIVSEPGRPNRQYQICTRAHGDLYIPPEEWRAAVPSQQGSWWPEWAAWLRARSAAPVPPPSMGAQQQGYPVLEDAPGLYVMEK